MLLKRIPDSLLHDSGACEVYLAEASTAQGERVVAVKVQALSADKRPHGRIAETLADYRRRLRRLRRLQCIAPPRFAAIQDQQRGSHCSVRAGNAAAAPMPARQYRFAISVSHSPAGIRNRSAIRTCWKPFAGCASNPPTRSRRCAFRVSRVSQVVHDGSDALPHGLVLSFAHDLVWAPSRARARCVRFGADLLPAVLRASLPARRDASGAPRCKACEYRSPAYRHDPGACVRASGGDWERSGPQPNRIDRIR